MTLPERGKVGLFGIGLAAYWPQFKGLKRRLEGYQRIVSGHLDKFCDVVDAGLVDSAPGLPLRARSSPAKEWSWSSATSAPTPQAARYCRRFSKSGAPVLILNLQPVSALDYPKTDTGEWLANCCSCCVPEIACAFARSRIDFHVVTGVLGVERGRFREAPPSHPDSQRAWQEIEELGPRRVRRQPAQAQPHRVPRPHLPRHVGHVQRLHPAHSPTRHTHRGAGNVRPGPAPAQSR